ncbi:MAG: protein kinase [Phycisphaerales bacterium]|nr:protein kinase [Phycisphaerales bacterium]
MSRNPPSPDPDSHPSGGMDSFALWEAGAAEPVQVGTTLGRYRILELLGEGGMGRVYLAEQSGTLRRQVAVKVLKTSVDAAHILERFRFEQQTLARLSHVAVAQVLDSGETTDGTPYFVMEYVNGLALTQYADKHHLTIDERLQLFIDICGGVRHAHGRGILHRDLKPSNILVAREGNLAMPKVIDWGIAHAIDFEEPQQSGERPVGTPEYMSPEQARRHALDVRSDIYSLGVVLHQLLSGGLPLESEAVRSSGDLGDAIERAKPLPPSERLATDEGRDTLAGRRGADVDTLVRRLRAGPDGVVMRAMSPRAEDRYESIDDLVADVRRCLAEPPRVPGRMVTWGPLVALLIVGAAVLLIGVLIGRSSRQPGEVQPPVTMDPGRVVLPAPPASEPWLERYQRGHQGTAHRWMSTQVDAFPAMMAAAGDGRRVVTVEAGHAVLYDLDTLALVARLDRVTGHRGCIGFAPDSSTVVTVSPAVGDGLHLWNANDGTPHAAPTLPGAVVMARFSNDGSTLVVATERALFLLRAPDWTVAGEVGLPRGDVVEDLATTGDDAEVLVALADGGMFALEVASADMSLRPLVTDTGSTAVATSGDGHWVAGAMTDRSLRIGRVDGEGDWRTLRGHELQPAALALNADGTRLASADLERLVLWDVTTGRLLAEWRGVGMDVLPGAFDAGSGRFLAEASRGAPLLIDAATGATEVRLPGVEDALAGIEFVAAGREVVGASIDGRIHRWTLEQSDTDLVIAPADRWIRDATFTPDGTTILAVSGHPTARLPEHHARLHANALDAFDGTTGVHRRRLATFDSAPLRLDLSTGGDLLAIVFADGTVRVLDPETGRELESLRSPESGAALERVRFSGGGRWLLASDSNERLYRWDREATGPARAFEDETMAFPITAIAADDAGRRVAAAARDGLVRVWDASTGDLLHRVEPLNSFANDLEFSGDGRYLIAAGGQRAAVLDLEERAAVLVTERLGTEALAAVLLPDEPTLLIGTGTFIQVHDLASNAARAQLECPPMLDGPRLIDDMREIRVGPSGDAVLVVHDGRVLVYRALPARSGD